MKTYTVTDLNAEVKARLDRADASDCYIDESGDVVLVGEPFTDLTGLTCDGIAEVHRGSVPDDEVKGEKRMNNTSAVYCATCEAARAIHAEWLESSEAWRTARQIGMSESDLAPLAARLDAAHEERYPAIVRR